MGCEGHLCHTLTVMIVLMGPARSVALLDYITPVLWHMVAEEIFHWFTTQSSVEAYLTKSEKQFSCHINILFSLFYEIITLPQLIFV